MLILINSVFYFNVQNDSFKFIIFLFIIVSTQIFKFLFLVKFYKDLRFIFNADKHFDCEKTH